MALNDRGRVPHAATVPLQPARVRIAQARLSGKLPPHAATVQHPRSAVSAAVGSRGSTLQPAWAKIAASGASGQGGGKGNGGGGGGLPLKPAPKAAPVKKRVIVVSKAARKHYGHHASPHLPTSDLTLIQAVNEDWERFEPSDDGYWRYELGEYNTLRQGGRWEPREWCIVLVFEELSGEWVVTHFGPSN